MAQYELTRTDKKKWLRNLMLFIAPVGLMYLTQVQSAIADGIQAADFYPSEFTLGAITLYVVNTAYDLIRKFIANNE